MLCYFVEAQLTDTTSFFIWQFLQLDTFLAVVDFQLGPWHADSKIDKHEIGVNRRSTVQFPHYCLRVWEIRLRL